MKMIFNIFLTLASVTLLTRGNPQFPTISSLFLNRNNARGSVEWNKNYIGESGTQGASYNTDEFMAECFQEYKNYSTPSEFAVKVGKLMDQYFKK